jgi:hypothetical protein
VSCIGIGDDDTVGDRLSSILFLFLWKEEEEKEGTKGKEKK